MRTIALVFVVLLTVKLSLSLAEMKSRQAIVSEAEAAARRNWLNQGNRDPHGAAHHGTFLFKPVPPLAMFDPGLYSYLGTTVRIEAHVRHRLTNLPAENEVDSLRLTFFTPAQMVQGILPLLIIFIGFDMVTREREQGTLPLLLSCGVRWPDLLIAKLSSLSLIAASLSAPWWGMLLFSSISTAFHSAEYDTAIRALLVLLASILLLLMWCFTTVAVSATASTSKSSLGILVTLWCVTTLCSAPFAATVASIAFPLPTQEEVKQWSDRKKFDPVSGENIFRKTREDLQQKLLAEYKVQTVKDLPFKFDGAVMKVAEEQTDQIYETDVRELNGKLSQHDRVLQWAGLVSPFLVARQLSTAFCGTDRLHHEHFSEAAETYRRSLVLAVNEADTQKESPDALRGPALWESVADFQYDPTAVRSMLPSLQLWLVLLLVWSAGSFLLFCRSMVQKPLE